VLVSVGRRERAAMPAVPQRVIARWRSRPGAAFREIAGRLGLACRGVRAFWGLLERAAVTVAARALTRVCLADTDQSG
jgi:hypothetical protein